MEFHNQFVSKNKLNSLLDVSFVHLFYYLWRKCYGRQPILPLKMGRGDISGCQTSQVKFQNSPPSSPHKASTKHFIATPPLQSIKNTSHNYCYHYLVTIDPYRCRLQRSKIQTWIDIKPLQKMTSIVNALLVKKEILNSTPTSCFVYTI